MPSFTTIFIIAMLVGAGLGIAHYYGTQVAAKTHQLLTWLGAKIHPAVGKVIAPVPVAPFVSQATQPAEDRDHSTDVVPWEASAAFVAYIPGDPNGAGTPNLYQRNWIATLSDAAFKALLTVAIGPVAGDPSGAKGLGTFANLSDRQWTWLATVDACTAGRVGRL